MDLRELKTVSVFISAKLCDAFTFIFLILIAHFLFDLFHVSFI